VVVKKSVPQKFALMRVKSFGSKKRPRYEVAMSVTPDDDSRMELDLSVESNVNQDDDDLSVESNMNQYGQNRRKRKANRDRRR
jgi:hypothetical protein